MSAPASTAGLTPTAAQATWSAGRRLPPLVRRPAAFALGLLMIAAGVGLHAIEFLIGMDPMPTDAMPMAGMPLMAGAAAHAMPGASAPAMMAMGWLGAVGMAVDLAGLLLATWAMLPPDWRRRRAETAHAVAAPPAADVAPMGIDADLKALDATRLTRRHWLLIARLLVTLVLDTMKPATIALMLPGLIAEYHLLPAHAALLPLFALAGTTAGSILFGLLADVAGRRMCMVLTTLILAATSICGLMPAFYWQMAMCFVMGMAAGGEVPLTYAMLAETMPARHRGWMSVLLGGLGSLGGLLAATGAALLLEPQLGWRSLFLPNLPTGLIMLALVRWIPESPRFLLQNGYVDEARSAIAAVGGELGSVAPPAPSEAGVGRRGMRDLLRQPLAEITVILCLYGFAWGLCNWGFITWLPTMLRGIVRSPEDATRLLATSAFLAIPGTLVAAALYAVWSSKWTAVVAAAATTGTLLLAAMSQSAIVERPELLTLCIVLLLVASNSMIGVLAPYSVELYPTALRGTGTGVVAASSKVAGVVGPGLIGAVLTVAAGLTVPALVVGAPVAVASLLMAWRGPETRGRSLEDLASTRFLAPAPELAGGAPAPVCVTERV
jgi:putative MFS transporter